jgi:hypothetical protein
MLQIDENIEPKSLSSKINTLFDLAGGKIQGLQRTLDPRRGAPVFTVKGIYTSRGWTEWTRGFQFGSAILHYDFSGDKDSLEIGRSGTLNHMAKHLSHVGVHDHGFNVISTYGNLHRLVREGRIPEERWEKTFYELALKVSGAVQAVRWTQRNDELGYIYSFNGPHSVFVDTVRSLRSLAVAHQLGQVLMGEQDKEISLLERLLQHAETTARYNVFFGEGRDAYDVRGRVAQESVFNVHNGSFRCVCTQQGYSPFSTWMRGLGWALLGYSEQLEFLETVSDAELEPHGGKEKILRRFLNVAEAVADYYIEQTPIDGIPYWDTGAPNLARLGDYLGRPADPFNNYEPVDSSAAVIAAQGFLRLGNYLMMRKATDQKGSRYLRAGLTIADHVFSDPYLSTDPKHQGLILHSVYHRPKGWDYVPPEKSIPCGESAMWGDYHALELALLIRCMAGKKRYLCFFV